MNITVEGQLGMPRVLSLRLPPPFGTPREVVRALEAAGARMHNRSFARRWMPKMLCPRITVAAIGVMCTVAAAMLGSYTSQHRHPLTQHEGAPAWSVAQMPVSEAEFERPSTGIAESAGATVGSAAVFTPTVETPATVAPIAPGAATEAKTATLRRLARVVGRTASPAKTGRTPGLPYDRPAEETRQAPTETVSTAAGFVRPNVLARVELERHVRLTD